MEKLLKGLEKRSKTSKKLRAILYDLGKEIYTNIPKEYEIMCNDEFTTGIYNFGEYHIGVNNDYLVMVETEGWEHKPYITINDMTGLELVFLANNVKKYINELTKKVDNENVNLEKALNMFK